MPRANSSRDHVHRGKSSECDTFAGRIWLEISVGLAGANGAARRVARSATSRVHQAVRGLHLFCSRARLREPQRRAGACFCRAVGGCTGVEPSGSARAIAGPIERARFLAMTGLPPRAARPVLASLIDFGELQSATSRAPVASATPLKSLRFLFPRLLARSGSRQ